jgi:hypothetical protein
MTDSENGMKRMTLILIALIVLVFLAQSKSFINLGGRDGNLLLGGLTNNSTSNSSINLLQNASALHLGGDDGNLLLQDLTNASKNLSDWGSKPPKAPLPPKYDSKSEEANKIVRMNHVGY